LPGRIEGVTATADQQKRVSYDGYKILDAITNNNTNYVIAENSMQNVTSLILDSGYKKQVLYTTK